MKDRFETSDIYLAAYLLAAGHKLASVNGHDPQRVVFVLTPFPGPEELASYAEGKATVNVQRFVSAERQLKRMVWAIRDGTEAR